MAELASVHAEAEDWVRDVVLEALPPKASVGIRDASLVQDVAFGLYARGAGDFRPVDWPAWRGNRPSRSWSLRRRRATAPPAPRPRGRARPGMLIALWALVVAAVFFIGLVIGKALEDAPAPGGTQTLVRTLEPSTVGPGADRDRHGTLSLPGACGSGLRPRLVTHRRPAGRLRRARLGGIRRAPLDRLRPVAWAAGAGAALMCCSGSQEPASRSELFARLQEPRDHEQNRRRQADPEADAATSARKPVGDVDHAHEDQDRSDSADRGNDGTQGNARRKLESGNAQDEQDEGGEADEEDELADRPGVQPMTESVTPGPAAAYQPMNALSAKTRADTQASASPGLVVTALELRLTGSLISPISTAAGRAPLDGRSGGVVLGQFRSSISRSRRRTGSVPRSSRSGRWRA